MLIAAVSGRALAQAARRAGFRVLVADFFGDDDTLAAADGFALLPGGLKEGVDAGRVAGVLNELVCQGSEVPPPHREEGDSETLTPPSPLWGSAGRAEGAGRVRGGGTIEYRDDDATLIDLLILGSGFERMPDLIDELAKQFPLAGNAGAQVRRVKDPRWLTEQCALQGIPHPEIVFDPPKDRQGWVAKTAGGAGGMHIRNVTGEKDVSESDGRYFQRRVEGDSISALFVADGATAHIVGFSEQWTSPVPNSPYRYGGAARLTQFPAEQAATVQQWLDALTEAANLYGLCSADFIRDGETMWLIEINPRPGATPDIFDSAEAPLISAHIAACRSEPFELPNYTDSAASMIAYAGEPIASFPEMDWPDWAADRQAAGSKLAAGDPVCTVLANGPTAREARRAAQERLEWLERCWTS